MLWAAGAAAAAYLVSDYGPAGCSGICCNDNAAVEETADNGGSGAGGLGEGHTLGVEGGIAVVVGEVEAGHGGDCARRDVGCGMWVWFVCGMRQRRPSAENPVNAELSGGA